MTIDTMRGPERAIKAVKLRDSGLSYRDIGTILGCKDHRASQLVACGRVYIDRVAEWRALGWKRDISTRARNCLSHSFNSQYFTPEQVAALDYGRFTREPNAGKKIVAEVVAALSDVGLKFAGQDAFKARSEEYKAKLAADILNKAKRDLEIAQERFDRIRAKSVER